jgi:DNA-binding response OmpR family regulator
MKVLVMEDYDHGVQKITRSLLENNGYEVMSVELGKEGLDLALVKDYDCVVLDTESNDFDGMKIIKSLREEDIDIPLMMVSENDDINFKVQGLESGADDFLAKPFDFKEFLARIKSITRRRDRFNTSINKEILRCGELKLDLLNREFTIRDKSVFLTNNEFNLLTYFMKNKDRVISRKELSERVWRIYFDTQTNFVNVYISYLRKKIREYTDMEYIETVRGEGFRLVSE